MFELNKKCENPRSNVWKEKRKEKEEKSNINNV